MCVSAASLWVFPWRLLKRSMWRFVKRHVVNDFGLIAVLTFLGGLLVLFGAAFGIYHWVKSAGSGIPTTTGTVMIAVLPLILGFQMLLQALSIEVQGSPGAKETRDFSHSNMSLFQAGPSRGVSATTAEKKPLDTASPNP